MKKAKIIRNVLAVLVVLAAVVCVSCDALLENGRRGNITINLPPISSSARAISADKINDLKGDIASYRVIVKVNGQRREKRGGGGNYSFEMPVGVKIEITVECVNSSGDVIARARKTHTVKSGTNNISINLSRDGELVGAGGIPSDGGGEAPVSPTTELKSAPTVGSIIMKDGSIRTVDNIGSNADNTIAIVYKVDSSARKVWAVGKVLSTSHYGWADSSADGYNHNLVDLREPNYSDGSTGLDILRAAVSDANGSDFATKYPAWDYACNYGTKQGLTSFQTGWYLPSIQELQEVYNSKATIENALAQTGVSKNSFESYGYWSSTQHPSSSNAVSALIFFFSNGTSSQRGKNNLTGCVCAVRQFSY